LVERSFGQYLATLYLRPQQQEIARCRGELEQQRSLLASVDWKLLNQYEKLQERLKEEKRLLQTLEHQADEMQASELAIALSFAVAGTFLTLKGEQVRLAQPLPAVLVTKVPGSGRFPYLVCLGQNNRWYVVTVDDVKTLRGEIPRLSAVDRLQLPPELPLKPGQSRAGSESTQAIAYQVPDVPGAGDLAPEVYAQLQRMEAVQAQIDAHPVHRWGDRSQILKRQRRIETLQEQIRDREAKLDHQTQRHWEEFVSLMEVLQSFDCLDELVPTELGQATAALRGDNELWLGLSVMSGELDHLDPHHLAAACAALVTEVSRPDTWTRYDVSNAVLEALQQLRGIRRQLFQIQRRHQVAFPVWLEDELIGLIEQWALGVDWSELCGNTSLDEGDVVRILRRTLDFLSQIPHVPNVSQSLRSNAIRAAQLIDRFPVNESIE
jgi:superfamily II RNA helicase